MRSRRASLMDSAAITMTKTVVSATRMKNRQLRSVSRRPQNTCVQTCLHDWALLQENASKNRRRANLSIERVRVSVLEVQAARSLISGQHVESLRVLGLVRHSVRCEVASKQNARMRPKEEASVQIAVTKRHVSI